MAQDSWPAPGHSSGALTEAEWERVMVRAVDNGVYGTPADLPVVVAGSGLQVTVKSERSGHIRGHNWYSGTTDYTHSVTSNSSGQTRIDRVVLQLDRAAWTVRSIVKAGTPGAGAPALVQATTSTGLYEIPLAQVTVTNNASSVTVTRDELFVGTRVRPCTSIARPANPVAGDVGYESDTGRWIGWTGSAWIVMAEDTGWVSLSTPNANWTAFGTSIGKRKNGVVTLRISVQRANNTLSSGTTGSQLVTLPAALRPTDHNEYFAAVVSGTGAAWRAEIRTDSTTEGGVWIEHGSGDITVGRNINLTCTYAV